MSFWLETNQAFHAAARERAAALVDEFGLDGAYKHARERREQLMPGEAKTFAYNVELLTAEAAGISLDEPSASPLGEEAPVWLLPFVTRKLLARATAVAARLMSHLHVRAAPALSELLGAYADDEKKPRLQTPPSKRCARPT